MLGFTVRKIILEKISVNNHYSTQKNITVKKKFLFETWLRCGIPIACKMIKLDAI